MIFEIDDNVRLHDPQDNPEWDKYPVTGYVYGLYIDTHKKDIRIIMKLDKPIVVKKPKLVVSIITVHPDKLIKISKHERIFK